MRPSLWQFNDGSFGRQSLDILITPTTELAILIVLGALGIWILLNRYKH